MVAENKRNAEIIKPLAVGDDVRRWRVVYRDRWLIYMCHGIDTKGMSAILDHLRRYREQLEQRATKQEWYELQQPQERYAKAFEKTKIVFPDIAKEPRFALDAAKRYVTNTTYFIPIHDLYLLGVLNSASMWDYAKQRLTVLGDADKGGRLRFFRQFVQALPIPDAPTAERAAISGLVQKCLNTKGVGREKWEQEINERVAALYGL